ncbi:MAG: biopolymer transporter ExbD [Deltaproteobacteria bacterium]|nr:biopolymer transporter ExbD [Deltaproteobacteria bacterium]
MRKLHRKAAVAPGSMPNSAINVTPMVDVVLVLLIIFMVVTPLLDKDIEIAIPKTETVEDRDEVPAEQLLLRINDKGDLFLNDRPITLEEYAATMKRQMEARTDSMKVLFIAPADDANYGRMVTVIDVAKGAGVRVIGMSTADPNAPAP